MPSGYRWSKATSAGLIQKTRTVRTGGVPAVGWVVGDGAVVLVGLAVGLVGLAVGEAVTPPVQATPLRVKLPGTGLLEVQPPLKPKDVLPPVAREPLYE